ncbi:MAG TPA: hypothetical protein VMG10_20720 [Gemmataceae bacterium]|nr:hypothetical protein [Gemmataceae bacterium]
MRTATARSTPPTEDLLAELTQVAYGVVLRHGIKGPFIDVELELWRELRRVLNRREEEEAWLL